MARSKKTVQEIVHDEYPEFVETIIRMGVPELDKRLNQYAKEDEEISDSLENNETIKSLKEQVSEATGPFRDAKKANRLKRKYIISLIKEKGGQ